MKSVKLFSILCIVLIAGCNNPAKEKAEPVVTKDSSAITTIPVVNKDSLLSSTGRQVLSVLKNKQYDSLVHWFSDSVHFSPYGFIGSGTQTLSANDFTGLLSSGKQITWGYFDGSGDPIILTAKQYIEKFIYTADFLNAEKSAIDQFIGSGNSLNNLREKYPGSRFAEYYFSGFDKKYDGMDWTCLRLVFTEANGKYYLIAIVHDQWTI